MIEQSDELTEKTLGNLAHGVSLAVLSWYALVIVSRLTPLSLLWFLQCFTLLAAIVGLALVIKQSRHNRALLAQDTSTLADERLVIEREYRLAKASSEFFMCILSFAYAVTLADANILSIMLAVMLFMMLGLCSLIFAANFGQQESLTKAVNSGVSNEIIKKWKAVPAYFFSFYTLFYALVLLCFVILSTTPYRWLFGDSLVTSAVAMLGCVCTVLELRHKGLSYQAVVRKIKAS